MTPPWVLYPSEIMQMGFKELLHSIAVFARSINVLGWQPVAPKSREHDFQKKKPDFLKFMGPATHLWVLKPSDIMHLGPTDHLLARAVFARSIKMLGWQPGAPKIPGARFSEKKNLMIY